jgi:hypothetical protein
LLGGATHKCHKKKNLLVLLHLQILITRTFFLPQVFVDPVIQQKRIQFQPAHQRFFKHGSNELTKQGSKARENKHITYIWRDSWVQFRGPLYHLHHCHLLCIGLP